MLSDTIAGGALATAPGSERGEGVKAAAFSPDAAGFSQPDDASIGMPAFAGAGGAAAAPAGADVVPPLDDEAAPLRFKGTTTARRTRTAVPGVWAPSNSSGNMSCWKQQQNYQRLYSIGTMHLWKQAAAALTP